MVVSRWWARGSGKKNFLDPPVGHLGHLTSGQQYTRCSSGGFYLRIGRWVNAGMHAGVMQTQHTFL